MFDRSILFSDLKAVILAGRKVLIDREIKPRLFGELVTEKIESQLRLEVREIFLDDRLDIELWSL
jgi:hypothetical protein